MTRQVIFGAFAPSIGQQFPDMDPFIAEHLQIDAQSIIRLMVRGIITNVETDKARKRLVKQITRALK